MSKNGNVLLQASGYQGGSPLVNKKKQQQTEKTEQNKIQNKKQRTITFVVFSKLFWNNYPRFYK